MKSCLICNKKINFGGKRATDGFVCKECSRLIPSWVDISVSDKEHLTEAYNSTLEKKNRFRCTASYGKLEIDGVNNLLCIRKNKHDYTDIYYVSELKQVGLFCTNLRNTGQQSDHVTCNVKFRLALTNGASKEITIATNETCPYDYVGNKRVSAFVGNGQIECREPVSVTAFRALFNQMIDNEVASIEEKLSFIRKTKPLLSESEKTEEWARGVFLFDKNEPIDAGVLKQRRNSLIKLYHPDVGNPLFEDNNLVTEMIISAYNILKSS